MASKTDNNLLTQDILRLSAKQTVELLEQMDEAATGEVSQERRHAPRVPYQPVSRLAVLLNGEPSGRRSCMLAPRNLSRTGISLLHGKFVYPGIACVVGLCAMDGQTVPVHGTVIWCRYVTGRVHEHGVEFTDPIDLPEFVPGAEPA